MLFCSQKFCSDLLLLHIRRKKLFQKFFSDNSRKNYQDNGIDFFFICIVFSQNINRLSGDERKKKDLEKRTVSSITKLRGCQIFIAKIFKLIKWGRPHGLIAKVLD